MGKTPFSLTYGTKTVLSVEINYPTARVVTFDDDKNAEAMGHELDLLEEKRIEAHLVVYQDRAARYYNKKVINR